MFDRLFARNTRRKATTERGNYAFRSRRKKVRFDVHRLDLNPETDATRREQRRKVIRWGFKFALLILLATTVFSAGKIVVRDAFVDNNRFRLQHFSVITDGDLSVSEIIAATGLKEGMNMLHIPLVEVREKLRALPQVRNAKVSRGYPGLLFLEVEQRRPVAWLECPEQRLEARVPGYGCLLDEFGVVLPSSLVTTGQQRLPVIQVQKLGRLVPGQPVESAPEMLAALSLLAAHESSALSHSLSIKRVDASKACALTVTYDARFNAVFPSENFERDIQRLQYLVEEASRRNWKLATVDLRVENNVPVTLRAGAAVSSTGEPAPAPRRTALADAN